MCRIFLLLLAFTLVPGPLLALELTEEERAWLDENKPIVFVSQSNYPPFEYVNNEGRPAGMSIELARWLSTELGFNARFQDMTFQEAQQAVLSGDADVITSLFYSEQRDQDFEFTQAIFQVPASIFVAAERTDIQRLAGLEGKRIAMQAGDYALEYLQSQDIDFQVRETENFVQATRLVAQGEADAVIGDEQIVIYHIYEEGLTDQIKKVGEPLYVGENGMAATEDNAFLVGILNKGIDRARASGVLDNINRKWLGTRFPARESFLFHYYREILIIVGLGLLALISVWVWNRRLQTLVRRRTEAYRRSQERFQTIYNSVNDAVMIQRIDDGAIVDVNHRAEELFQIRRMEFIGKGIEILSTDTPGYTPADAKRMIDRALQDGSHLFEWHAKRRNGQPMWMEVSLRPATIDGEQRVLAVVRDISERKRVEEQLRLSQFTIEQTLDLVFWIDSTGQIINVNEAVCRRLGYDRKELIGKHVWDLDPNFHKKGWPSHWERTRQRKTYQIESQLTTSLGHSFPVEIVINHILTEDSELHCTFARDITERKAAEEQLRRREQEFANLAHNSPDIIIRYNREGRPVYANPEAEKLLQRPQQDIIGRPLWDLYEDRSLVVKWNLLLEDVCRSCTERSIEFSISNNGDKHDYQVKVVPEVNRQGIVDTVLSVARDITPLKKAEIQIRESESRFRAVVENMPVLVVALDSQGHVKLWNKAAERISGYTAEEAMEEPRFGRRLYPDTQYYQYVRNRIDESPGDHHDLETTITCKDGSARVISWTNISRKVPIPGWHDWALGIDVTERRRAEENLKNRERILSALAETTEGLIRSGEFASAIQKSLKALGEATSCSRISICETEIDSTGSHNLKPRYEWAAPGVRSLAEAPGSQSIIGRQFSSEKWVETLSSGEVLHGPLSLFPEKEKELLQSVEIKSIAIFPILFEQSWWGIIGLEDCVNERQWSHAELETLRSAAAIVGSAIERRRIEEEIIRARDEWERTFDSVPDLIVILDRDFRVLRANRALLERLGAAKEDFLGRIAYKELSGMVRFQSGHPFSCTPNAGNSHTEEQYIDSLGGHFLVTAAPLHDREGSLLGAVYIARDITESKKEEEKRRDLEHQMLQSQKLESLGVLAGGIAHDFNNLLTGIMGNNELALLRLPGDSPCRRNLEEVDKASRRAAELCRQMLAYSGKGRFILEPINLNEVLKEITGLLHTSISKKADLELRLAPELPPIQGDATQIRQLVMNLITNASEALEGETGKVFVTTGVRDCTQEELKDSSLGVDIPPGHYVFFQVADTGAGMDKETQEKIFDPFYTTKFTGRGLGLAAAQGIIHGHKGSIHISSEPRKGSSFTIYFPEGAEAPRRQTPPREVPIWKGRGRILLADDEASIRELGREILERAGFQVTTAPDGADALEFFMENDDEIICVVLDLTMPRMSGEEVFSEIHRLRPDIPVILSSGYDEQHVTGEFHGTLAGFIQKPYKSNDLLKVIKRALEESNQS